MGDATNRPKLKMFELTTKAFPHQAASFKTLQGVSKSMQTQKGATEPHLPACLRRAQALPVNPQMLMYRRAAHGAPSSSQGRTLKSCSAEPEISFVCDTPPHWLEETTGHAVCKPDESLQEQRLWKGKKAILLPCFRCQRAHLGSHQGQQLHFTTSERRAARREAEGCAKLLRKGTSSSSHQLNLLWKHTSSVSFPALTKTCWGSCSPSSPCCMFLASPAPALVFVGSHQDSQGN